MKVGIIALIVSLAYLSGCTNEVSVLSDSSNSVGEHSQEGRVVNQAVGEYKIEDGGDTAVVGSFEYVEIQEVQEFTSEITADGEGHLNGFSEQGGASKADIEDYGKDGSYDLDGIDHSEKIQEAISLMEGSRVIESIEKDIPVHLLEVVEAIDQHEYENNY